jgi:hypothetical protein
MDQVTLTTDREDQFDYFVGADVAQRTAHLTADA